MSLAGWRRVLARAAQENPVAVRTMIAVVPGRLPLCHRLPLPSLRTFQPRAYFTAVPGSLAGPGVVIAAMLSRVRRVGWRASMSLAKRVRSAALPSQPP